jgi:broad specificity phosphatase PhoE
MKIYIIRHGETDWNQDKKIQGPTSSKLTENGLLHARQYKQYFEREKITFNQVYYSPTLRTQQTLNEIIPSYLDEKHIFATKEIEERNHVDLVGLNKAEIEAKLGKKFKQRLSWELYFEGTNKSTLTGHFPNDESIEDIRRKINAFRNMMFSQNKNSTILIVGHSIINQYLLEFLKFRTIGEKQFDDFQKNNEIRIITLNNDFKFSKLEKVEL